MPAFNNSHPAISAAPIAGIVNGPGNSYIGSMDPVDISRALVYVGNAEENEGLVKKSFWRKLRRVMGRVPFMEETVSAYYCAIDSETPTRVRAVILAGLAYFIIPTDLIPDFIAGIGFTDDVSVMMAVIGTVSSHIRPPHVEAARRALAQEKAPSRF